MLNQYLVTVFRLSITLSLCHDLIPLMWQILCRARSSAPCFNGTLLEFFLLNFLLL